MDKLQSLLQSQRFVLADGAMGTMLIEAGLEPGESLQAWNIAHPDRIRSVHRAYLDAGSQLILTNTFGGNRFRLARHGLQARVDEVNRAGAALLKAEIEHSGANALVAGDIGPTGELMQPLGKTAYADAVDAFAEQAAALIAGGADLIWIETMSALEEVQAAIEGARKAAAQIPIVVTMTFERHGRTMMGISPRQALQSLTVSGVRAFGGNCGTGPEELLAVLRTLRDLGTGIPLIFKPNAGVPELADGKATYNATPENLAQSALAAVQDGARVIGACCGSTPDHIRAMHKELASASHMGNQQL